MRILVSPYTPPGNQSDTFYLIDVDKGNDLKNQYIVNIAHLQDEICNIFTDKYKIENIKNNFYTVDFYSLNILINEVDKFGPDKRMQYTRKELIVFFLNGIGKAIEHFVKQHHPDAIIAIPIREGLATIYRTVMRDNAQKMGYTYISDYEEFAIYVIET